jgi:hypothetical protein
MVRLIFPAVLTLISWLDLVLDVSADSQAVLSEL